MITERVSFAGSRRWRRRDGAFQQMKRIPGAGGDGSPLDWAPWASASCGHSIGWRWRLFSGVFAAGGKLVLSTARPSPQGAGLTAAPGGKPRIVAEFGDDTVELNT